MTRMTQRRWDVWTNAGDGGDVLYRIAQDLSTTNMHALVRILRAAAWTANHYTHDPTGAFRPEGATTMCVPCRRGEHSRCAGSVYYPSLREIVACDCAVTTDHPPRDPS
jgi:hypothetical protein